MGGEGGFVLGVDGGGSKTEAWAAGADGAVAGRGRGGPANPVAIGWRRTFASLDAAVDGALRQAGRAGRTADAACLAVAGAGRAEHQAALRRWAERRRLARRVLVVHDGQAVLAAGAPEGWGVALIAGTGSLAYGRDAAGREARAGGWGAFLGDDGGAAAIGRDAVRAVLAATEGRAPPTGLTELVMEQLAVPHAEALRDAAVGWTQPARAAAALAEGVFRAAAAGDAAAAHIVGRAAEALAEQTAAVSRRLGLPPGGFPLVLSGGVFLGQPAFRQRVLDACVSRGAAPGAGRFVASPAAGAVKLALSAGGG